MSALNAQRVNDILLDCLFNDDEPAVDKVIADGVLNSFGFYPGRLAMHRDEIGRMLRELPGPFMQSQGGGWSFLNACMDRHGVQWTGLHKTVDELFVLGIATGQAKYLLPRELWAALPGSVPYLVVLDNQPEDEN